MIGQAALTFLAKVAKQLKLGSQLKDFEKRDVSGQVDWVKDATGNRKIAGPNLRPDRVYSDDELRRLKWIVKNNQLNLFEDNNKVLERVVSPKDRSK